MARTKKEQSLEDEVVRERNKETPQEEALRLINEEKHWLHNKATAEEIADWLIDQHEQYIQHINYTVQHMFLEGTDYTSRYMKLVYMNQLFTFLQYREIEYFDKEVGQHLANKNEGELLEILQVLNYI